MNTLVSRSCCAGALAGLHGRTGHAPAFIGAASAGLGAFLAMRHGMLGAFISACLTDIGARLADRGGEFATARHIAGRQTANLCTVHIKRDTAGHHFRVLLVQTRYGAEVAGVCAHVASFDTGCVLLICHDALLELMKKGATVLD
jgi:hypothetical protein